MPEPEVKRKRAKDWPKLSLLGLLLGLMPYVLTMTALWCMKKVGGRIGGSAPAWLMPAALMTALWGLIVNPLALYHERDADARWLALTGLGLSLLSLLLPLLGYMLVRPLSRWVPMLIGL